MWRAVVTASQESAASVLDCMSSLRVALGKMGLARQQLMAPDKVLPEQSAEVLAQVGGGHTTLGPCLAVECCKNACAAPSSVLQSRECCMLVLHAWCPSIHGAKFAPPRLLPFINLLSLHVCLPIGL